MLDFGVLSDKVAGIFEAGFESAAGALDGLQRALPDAGLAATAMLDQIAEPITALAGKLPDLSDGLQASELADAIGVLTALKENLGPKLVELAESPLGDIVSDAGDVLARTIEDIDILSFFIGGEL